MTDVNKHYLIKQCYELCQVIERCGASLATTNAVMKAGALMRDIEKYIDHQNQGAIAEDVPATPQTSLTSYGKKLIKLGNAMVDRNSTIKELSDLAFSCDLSIQFRIMPTSDGES